MRIALVIFSFFPSKTTGPIRHIAALARGLAERGNDVAILTSAADLPAGTPLSERTDGVKVERLRVAWKWGHWIQCPDLRARLVQGRFDVIHAQLYRNYFTETAAKASRKSGVPLVITPRGSLLGYRYLGESPVYNIPNVTFDILTRRRALKHAVLTVTSKHEAEDAYELGIPRERVVIIPHGLDFNRLPHPSTRAESDGTKLLFVGRIAEQRNVKFLLRGFALASKSNPRLRLSIVGEPIPSRYNLHEARYWREVVRLASQLRLGERVEFLGGAGGDALWNLYQTHDSFVYTSRYDNFGHALVEAAYFGLPVVSTDVGVAADLIQDGRGGILLNPDDDVGLAEAILRISRDSTFRSRCSSFIRQQTVRYTLARNVEAYENLYKTLVT